MATYALVAGNIIASPIIGVMFVASIMRNISNYSGKFEIDLNTISIIRSFTLAMFLSMTLISFKLWKPKALYLFMFVGKNILMGNFAYFNIFNITGRDYDAAIITFFINMVK